MSTEPPTFAAVFAEIAGPSAARPATVRAAFEAILSGAWTPAQIAGLLLALRMRGETSASITAAVEAMRSAMSAVDHGLEATLDTCGTGETVRHAQRSTAAAVVVAALESQRPSTQRPFEPVGERRRRGSLGVPISQPPARGVLRDAGYLLFAPTHLQPEHAARCE